MPQEGEVSPLFLQLVTAKYAMRPPTPNPNTHTRLDSNLAYNSGFVFHFAYKIQRVFIQAKEFSRTRN